MVQPAGDTAHIEMFFTRKRDALYCIVPRYRPQLRIRNYTAPAKAAVTILGSNRRIRWQQQGKDCVIDLSALQPGDINPELFVLKVQ
ncbi:hypothetical protein ECE50_012860 [Chitinophaga sp. Mgbs1]|uniref:Uncharacterized protein n=1 Tax=Chitinophaga solisilvae TaxID=1233460 RepID=A0A3S1D3Q2_9BACT|nr:hypothetical protein [Chitinophaga solisilvae]